MPYEYSHSPFISAIADRIEDIFDYAIRTRYRNFFIRLDLRFPDDGFIYNEAAIFCEFMRVFIQDRERNYGDVYYLAVREKDSSMHGHYHLFFLFDGKNTQSPFDHIEKATCLWGRYLSKSSGRFVNPLGLIQYGKPWLGRDDFWSFSSPCPQQCRGVMITRGSYDFEANYFYCHQQAMYLAKSYSKDSIGNKGHSWSSTQGIPRRGF